VTVQRLSAPAATSPEKVVAWLGAVQSQDYPLALWSVAQRVSKAGADVERAVADGAILRTHVLRPTWHFVARDDLRWMQTLTAPRVLAQLRYNDQRNGVDAALVARSTKLVESAIGRRGHLTRRELTDVLTRAGIRTTAWLVGQLLGHAELRAIICSGVPSGTHQTYALVDERAPKTPSMTRDEMLAELTRRYFQSHGPATVKDYQWWSGLRAPDAVRGIDMLGSAVTRVDVGGRSYVMMTKRPAWRPATGSAHVIQPFDELVVAYSESRDLVDISGAARGSTADGFALLTRGVVYGGQLIARWRTKPARGSRGIAIEPLRRLSSEERASIDAATTRFERFYFRTSRGSH
jgi:hypothetical protein